MPDRDLSADPEAVRRILGFWRYYMAGLLGLSLFAAIFGQFFLALEFTEGIWEAVIDRLLAIAVVALFVERAIEVYVNSWRRIGEVELVDMVREVEEDRPDDRAGQRAMRRQLRLYKLQTQRIAFLVALGFGVMIACTGLRVLDGLIVLGEEYRRNPVWQGRVWFAVDILLTGGVIGGGAAGVHDLIKTVSGQMRPPPAR